MKCLGSRLGGASEKWHSRFDAQCNCPRLHSTCFEVERLNSDPPGLHPGLIKLIPVGIRAVQDSISDLTKSRDWKERRRTFKRACFCHRQEIIEFPSLFEVSSVKLAFSGKQRPTAKSQKPRTNQQPTTTSPPSKTPPRPPDPDPTFRDPQATASDFPPASSWT